LAEVRYEDVYLKGYSNPTKLRKGLKNYFRFYNERRPHQALGHKSPMEIHRMNGSSVALKAGASYFAPQPHDWVRVTGRKTYLGD
jgi:hypothetical protein